MSYNCGSIPQEWKHVNVVPIFKKGNKGDVENYRPISLTCLVMKIFERIVKVKLLSLTNDLLDPRQHGFLEHKSCTTNMVDFCDSLALSLNDNIVNHVIYFDFDEITNDSSICKIEDNIHEKNIIISSWLNNVVMSAHEIIFMLQHHV